MKRTSEHPICPPRVQSKFDPLLFGLQTELFPRALPLCGIPIVVRKAHSPGRVADPVHEPQPRARARTCAQVVLDHNARARHSNRFAEPHHRVIGVMQDINEENKIELVIRAWQLVAAEGLHGNMGLRSRPGVNRQPLQIGPARQHLTGEQAVAAAHVEDGNIGRDQFAEMASEDADATLMNLSIVNSADEPHLRCIPRMLIKKLERMV